MLIILKKERYKVLIKVPLPSLININMNNIKKQNNNDNIMLVRVLIQ